MLDEYLKISVYIWYIHAYNLHNTIISLPYNPLISLRNL